jgi:hypothetical protein
VQCYTFEWENAPHGEAEANPDVYTKILPQVRNTNATGPVVRAADFSDTLYGAVSGRDAGPTFIVNDCAAGTTCTISAVAVPFCLGALLGAFAFAQLRSYWGTLAADFLPAASPPALPSAPAARAL